MARTATEAFEHGLTQATLFVSWLVAEAFWAFVGFGVWVVLLVRAIGIHSFSAIMSAARHRSAPSGRDYLAAAATYYVDGFRNIHRSVFGALAQNGESPMLEVPSDTKGLPRLFAELCLVVFLAALFWMPAFYLAGGRPSLRAPALSSAAAASSAGAGGDTAFTAPTWDQKWLKKRLNAGKNLTASPTTVRCKVGLSGAVHDCNAFPDTQFGRSAAAAIQKSGRAHPAMVGRTPIDGAEILRQLP